MANIKTTLSLRNIELANCPKCKNKPLIQYDGEFFYLGCFGCDNETVTCHVDLAVAINDWNEKAQPTNVSCRDDN